MIKLLLRNFIVIIVTSMFLTLLGALFHVPEDSSYYTIVGIGNGLFWGLTFSKEFVQKLQEKQNETKKD